MDSNTDISSTRLLHLAKARFPGIVSDDERCNITRERRKSLCCVCSLSIFATTLDLTVHAYIICTDKLFMIV